MEDTVEVPVQFNGKLRSKIVVPANSDAAALEAAARADEIVEESGWQDGREGRGRSGADGKFCRAIISRACGASGGMQWQQK